MNLIHALKSLFLNIHSIIFTCMPTTPKWSHPFRFVDQYSACICKLSHACPIQQLCYLPYLIILKSIKWRLKSTTPLFMTSSAASCYFYLLGPNIPHNTLFSDTPKLCSSLIHIRICAGLDQTLKKINVQFNAGLSSNNPRHLKI
jgi:hypothetical protein